MKYLGLVLKLAFLASLSLATVTAEGIDGDLQCSSNVDGLPDIPNLTPSGKYSTKQSHSAGQNSETATDAGIMENLASAAADLGAIKRQVARWQGNLNKSRSAFWRDFDRTGVVNQQARNEYAYWLHQRESWAYWGSSLRSQLSTVGKAGITDILFSGFERPEDYPRGVSINSPPSDYQDNDDYRKFFEKVSTFEFLEHSGCSPSKSGTEDGRILYWLYYPFRSTDLVSQDLSDVRQYLTSSGKSNADLFAYVDKRFSASGLPEWGEYVRDFQQEVDGDSKALAGLAWHSRAPSLSTICTIREDYKGRLWCALKFPPYDIESTGTFENYMVQTALTGAPWTVSTRLDPFVPAELSSCHPDAVNAINRQILARHGDRYSRFFGSPSMQKTSLANAIRDAAVISCVNKTEAIPTFLGNRLAQLGFRM